MVCSIKTPLIRYTRTTLRQAWITIWDSDVHLNWRTQTLWCFLIINYLNINVNCLHNTWNWHYIKDSACLLCSWITGIQLLCHSSYCCHQARHEIKAVTPLSLLPPPNSLLQMQVRLHTYQQERKWTQLAAWQKSTDNTLFPLIISFKR